MVGHLFRTELQQGIREFLILPRILVYIRCVFMAIYTTISIATQLSTFFRDYVAIAMTIVRL